MNASTPPAPKQPGAASSVFSELACRLEKLLWKEECPAHLASAPYSEEGGHFSGHWNSLQPGERAGESEVFRFRIHLPVARDAACGKTVCVRWKTGAASVEMRGMAFCSGEPVAGVCGNLWEISLPAKLPGEGPPEIFVECASGEPCDPELEAAFLGAKDPLLDSLRKQAHVAGLLDSVAVEGSQMHSDLRRIAARVLEAIDCGVRGALSDAHRELDALILHSSPAATHKVFVAGWEPRSLPAPRRALSAPAVGGLALAVLDGIEGQHNCAHIEPQAFFYALLQKNYPEVFARLRRAAKRGRWQVPSAFWCLPDFGMVSGESVFRNLHAGADFAEGAFGKSPGICVLSDLCGLPPSLPQILREAGIRAALYLRTEPAPDPGDTFFWWKGLDGTGVLVHQPPVAPLPAPATPSTLLDAEISNRQKSVIPCSVLAVGCREECGAGSWQDVAETLEMLSGLPGLPGVRPLELEEIAARMEKHARELPVWFREFPGMAARPAGALPARSRRANRKAECLMREAECYDAVAAVLEPGRAPAAVCPELLPEEAAFEGEGAASSGVAAAARAWRLILGGQAAANFGSGPRGEAPDCFDAIHARAHEIGVSLLEGGLACLEKNIGTEGFREPLLIANPLGFRRCEVIDLPGGKPCLVDVPPCGYTVIDAADLSHTIAPLPVSVKASARGGTVAENGLLRLRWNRKAELVSVFDIENSRELLPEGETANRFETGAATSGAEGREPRRGRGGAPSPGGFSLRVLEESPLRAVIRISCKVGGSAIEQDIVLRAGSRRVDFITEIDWKEPGVSLQAVFPLEIFAPAATYETLFGAVSLPTHPTPCRPSHPRPTHTHRWVDLSEAGYGAALLNDCRNTCLAEAGTLRIYLLHGSDADLCHHTSTYSLYPHAGGWAGSGVLEQASALNTPLRTRALERGPGPMPPSQSFFHFDKRELALHAVKRPYRGDGVVLRLYETCGSRGTATLSTSLGFGSAWRTDALEREKGVRLEKGEKGWALPYKPHEILTVRLVA